MKLGDVHEIWKELRESRLNLHNFEMLIKFNDCSAYEIVKNYGDPRTWKGEIPRLISQSLDGAKPEAERTARMPRSGRMPGLEGDGASEEPSGRGLSVPSEEVDEYYLNFPHGKCVHNVQMGGAYACYIGGRLCNSNFDRCNTLFKERPPSEGAVTSVNEEDS